MIMKKSASERKKMDFLLPILSMKIIFVLQNQKYLKIYPLQEFCTTISMNIPAHHRPFL